MSPFACEVCTAGFATWNIEYRCTDNEGGGWPGTFIDVGKAIDHLKILAPEYNLDLDNVIIVGHSSGGHLALWSAARKKLSLSSPLYSPDSLAPRAVINIAGPGDLKSFQKIELKCCGSNIISALLKNGEGSIESKLAQTSPYELLPLSIKQLFISGEHDLASPLDEINKYVKKAKALNDEAELHLIRNAGHFEVVDPRGEAFKEILEIFKSLIKY